MIVFQLLSWTSKREVADAGDGYGRYNVENEEVRAKKRRRVDQ